MNKLISGAVALCLIASAGAAAAQPGRQDRSDRRVEAAREELRDARQDNRRDERAERRDDRWERKADRRYNAGRYQAPRGYQARQWRRGERLPESYRGRAYVVDYRRYALAPPPRGYQYNRVGNDVVLTAIATGVVASVVMGLFQ